VLPPGIGRRNGVPGGQVHELDAPGSEKGAVGDEEGIRSLRREIRKHRIDVLPPVGLENTDFQTEYVRGRLYFPQCCFGGCGRGRIDKDRYAGGGWRPAPVRAKSPAVLPPVRRIQN